jgi:predicted RNA-binding Zn-ribbon protein involved in translation (DUF1610 family)
MKFGKREQPDHVDTPRFYCDTCGAEVPQDAKNCPKCDRIFASVRCPVCGFSGEIEQFAKGCPTCGYSAESAATGSTAMNASRSKSPAHEQEVHEASDGLPLWVYIVTAAAVVIALTLLFLRIK